MSAAQDKRDRPSDVDAEQEIDLGRIWHSVIARWWLLVVGFVLGAIVGLLVSLGGGKQWKATSEIYLGQPLAANSSVPISSPPTSLGLATAYINSLYAERVASAESVCGRAKLSVSQLNGAISVKPILGLTGTKVGQPAPIMQLSVTGPKSCTTQKAADSLSRLVVAQFSPYPAQKVKIIQARLTQEEAQIVDVDTRLKAAQNAQAGLASSAADSQLVANYAQVISTLSNLRFALQSDITSAKQSIAQSNGIEAPRIVSPALAANEGGPSRRSGVVIGAIIGLILGLLAAVLWEPVGRQVRSDQAAD
jgi:subunit length determinant Wzz-like protein